MVRWRLEGDDDARLGGGTIYMRFSYKYLFRASAESSIKWGECFRLERWYRNARGVIGEEGGIKQNTRTVYRKQKQEKLKEGSGYRKEVYYRALSKQHIDMCCSSHTTAGWDDASSRRLLLVYYFHSLKRKKKRCSNIHRGWSNILLHLPCTAFSRRGSRKYCMDIHCTWCTHTAKVHRQNKYVVGNVDVFHHSTILKLYRKDSLLRFHFAIYIIGSLGCCFSSSFFCVCFYFYIMLNFLSHDERATGSFIATLVGKIYYRCLPLNRFVMVYYKKNWIGLHQWVFTSSLFSFKRLQSTIRCSRQL